jgi:tetratricopeptide (TPR) repeat protein/O-antigen ligase
VERGVRVLDALIEGGALALLLVAPLPFGSVDPWAQSGIEAAVLLLVVLTVARLVVDGELVLRWTPLLGPGFLMIGLVGLQIALGTSVNPHATAESARLFLAYFAFLLVLSLHLTTTARLRRLLWAVVLGGAGLAALGLANRAAGRVLLPWFPPDFRVTRLVSTFVNPNHQALYFEIVLFLAAGLLLRPRRLRGPRSAGASASHLPGAGRALRIAVLTGAMAVMAAALVLTFSRGGAAGLVAGLVVLLTLTLRGRSILVTAMAVTGVVVAGAGVVHATGGGWLLARFGELGQEPFADYRWAVWERTVRMLGEAPVLGVGLGAYQDAFPLYRPPGIGSDKLIDYAHNDYLQLGAETGFTGLVALAWGLAGLVGFVGRRLAARHDPVVRGLTAGGLAALTAVAAHSALDFGVHMPANALMTVVVAGMLPNVVALRTRVESGGGLDLPTWRRPVTARIRLAAAPALAALVVLSGLAIVPPAVADWHAQRAVRLAGEVGRARGAVRNADLETALGELRRAVALDPRNAEVSAALADTAEQAAFRIWSFGVTLDGQRLGEPAARLEAAEGYLATAYAGYQRSLALNPRAARVHDRFGRFLGALETVRVAIRGSSRLRPPTDPQLLALLDSPESLLPRAVAELRTGIRWDPLNPYRHRNLGLFALAHLQGSERTEVATDAFRAALAIEPQLLDEIADQLEATGAPPDVLLETIPRRAEVWLQLARRLDRQGRAPAAASAFERALAIARDPAGQAEIRMAYARSLLRTGQSRLALDHARQALVAAPRDYWAFGLLGEVYEALGLWAQAGEAYTEAVATVSGEIGAVNEQRRRLAAFYERRGQIAEALTIMRLVAETEPRDPSHHADLARLLERSGDADAALREYRVTLRLAGNHAGYHQLAAAAFARLGLLEEAAATYEAGMPPDPGPAQVHFRVELGNVYRRLGRADRAIEQYRYALKIDPTRGDARAGLEALAVPTRRAP